MAIPPSHVWIVEGLHHSIPGMRNHAHLSKAGAVRNAVSMVKIMLDDVPVDAFEDRGWKRPTAPTARTWRAVLKSIKALPDYKAAHVDVWQQKLEE